MKTRASWDVGIAPMCEKSDKNCCIEMSELPSLGLSENASASGFWWCLGTIYWGPSMT